MPWYFFAILGAAGATSTIILQKKVLGKEHALQLAVILGLIGSIFVLFLIPYVNFNLRLVSYFLIVFVSLITGLAFLFLMKALRHIEVSLTAPFYNLGVAYVAIMAFFFLGERLTTLQLLGVILLIIGGYTVNAIQGHIFQPIIDLIESKYIHYVLFSVLAYSSAYLLDKFILREVDFLSLFFFRQLFVTAFLLIISIVFYKGFSDLKMGLKKGGIILILVSLLGLIEYLSIFKALSIGEASLVLPVYRLWTLFAVIVGGEIFHENNLKRRAIGCIIMLIGVWLVIR